MEDVEEQITNFLDEYCEEAVRSFAQQLRIYLKDETEPAYELAGKSGQSINIGYGFTTTSWDCYCAIIAYQKHINISFPSGAYLKDPENLLHGTGKRVRHLKVKTLEDLQTPEVKRLLKAARQQALSLVNKDDRKFEDEVVTVIKTKSK